MQQITFKIEGGEDVVAYALEGENLLEVARKVNVAIDAPCSGNGSCGKCRVRLASGNLVCPPNRHISDEESKEGWILACEAAVGSEDIVIEVPDIASAYRSRMKIADLSDKREAEIFENIKNSIFSTGIGMGTGLKKIYVELIPPSLDDPMADIERVGNAIEEKTGTPVKLEYFALKKLPNIIRESDFSFCCLIKQEEGCSVLLDLWDEHDDHPIFGLAMDIGTTTVSAVIVDIETGEIISKASSGNGQVRWGGYNQQDCGGHKKAAWKSCKGSN